MSEVVPDWVIDGSKINGKLYIAPCNIERSHIITMCANRTMCDEMGIEFDDEKIYTLDELHEILQKAHENYPECTVLAPQQGNAMFDGYTWENMGDDNNIGVIEDCGTTDKVVSITECADYQMLAKTMREWYKEGLIMQDVTSNTEIMQYAMYDGRVFAYFAGGCELKGQSDDPDFKYYAFTVVPNWANSTAGVRMGYVVNAMTEHPDETFAVLEQLYINKDIIDLAGFGIEGENYVLNEEGKAVVPEGLTMETDTYTTAFMAWVVIPNVYGHFVMDQWDSDRNEKIHEYDENRAATSHALGCIFDSSNVADEYAACCNVASKYYNVILSGTVDPDEVMASFREELKAAGEDKVIAEKQAQLDAFLAGN